MAKPKDSKKEEVKKPAPAPGKNSKPAPAEKSKKESGKEDDKAAKRAARMAALKDRPAEQRPNSKQVDIISSETCSVETFGYPIRKTGTLAVSVLKDAKGNPVGIASTFIPGTRVKVKKNHGNIIPGVAGVGKEKEDDEDGEE